MDLENAGYYGPFACVLGKDLFNLGQRVELSRTLASDRIEPYLGGGPYLRSPVIPANMGAVIALGGAPVDLVIGTDLSAHFVQMSQEPRYIFAVSETIRLRIKDRTAGVPWRLLMLN